MNSFDFIVSLNEKKQYTYGREIAKHIETLDDLKMYALGEFDEDTSSIIDKARISVSVEANGELCTYLAERFNEGTATDIIKILAELEYTIEDYDEEQVIAYLECFGLGDFELQDVSDKMFGEGQYTSDADAAEYYLNNYRDDIPDDIKNVIDYNAAYTYFGLRYELVSHNGYYFNY